jgi:hypothetical protein
MSPALATIVVGRLIAGFGVGFVSAIIILYMVRSVSRDFEPETRAPRTFFGQISDCVWRREGRDEAYRTGTGRGVSFS